MSTSVRLPPDIFETIVDILAQDDDYRSIKKCALVCHSFIHFCRKHIFGSIMLLGQIFQESRVLQFQKLLSTTPEIGPYIRHLSFYVGAADRNNISLLETFKKITCLKTLSLHFPWNNKSMCWKKLLIKPMLLHLMHLPTLTHLSLSCIDKFSFSDLLPCPNLRYLNMNDITFDSSIDTLVADLPTSLIRLSDITIRSMSTSEITNMCTLRRADGKLVFDFEYVKSLFVTIEFDDDIQTARLLLDHCRQLTSVGVDLQGNDNVSDIHTGWMQIGVAEMLLPSLPTLRHLSFKFMVDDNDSLAGLSFELAAMNKNIVETIKIEITINLDSTRTGGDEWDRLDTTLTTKSIWQNLTSVSLTIEIRASTGYDDGMTDAMLDLNETRFPKLFSGQFVSFSFYVHFEGFD